PTSVQVSKPMPIPQSPHAPRFSGKHVREFIETLSELAKYHQVPDTDLPKAVIRYSTDKVKDVVRHLDVFKKQDWAAAKATLIQLYGAQDEPKRVSFSSLRHFCKARAKTNNFSGKHGFERYHRKFVALSSHLQDQGTLKVNEVNYWFYAGLPSRPHKVVRQQIDKKYLKKTSPPPMADVIAIIDTIYDVDSIDATDDDDSSSSDIDSDADSTDSDEGEDTDHPALQKSVRFKNLKTPKMTDLPAATPDEPPMANDPVDAIADQMKNLRIHQLQALVQKFGLQAGNVPMPLPSSANNLSGRPQGFSRACFICGSDHGPIRLCPQALILQSEGILIWEADQRKWLLSDGSNIPQAPSAVDKTNGIALYLCQLATAGIVPTATAAVCATVCDPPPHQAVSTSAGTVLDSYGALFEGNVHSIPDTQFDRRDDALTTSNPVTRSGRDTTARNIASPYTAQKPTKRQEPPPTVPKPGQSTPSTQPRPSAQAPAPPQSKPAPTAPNVPRPPEINTKNPTRKTQPEKGDVEMKDADRTRQYRFTSDLQEGVSIEDVEKVILDQAVTLPIRSLLGVSPALQRRVGDILKTRREYMNGFGASEVFTPEAESFLAQHEPYSYLDLPTADDRQAYEAMRVCAHSAQQRPGRFFAMTVGTFKVRIGADEITLMVDTGSELNLLPEALVNRLGLLLDHDGARWGLSGIHGDAQQLRGCCKDVQIRVGGHTFAHHFFVTRTPPGKSLDGIVGQPFLQFFVGLIDYNCDGSMKVTFWESGDRADPPTVTIPIVKPNHERNTDRI
ncbi:hypothetical protein OF83DRAFT_1033725, partial [Amylostereum chailletii]